MKMHEKQNPAGANAKRDLLEMWYFMSGIIGVIVSIMLGVLNLHYDHILTKPEEPPVGNDSVVVEASVDGDGNAASNTAVARDGSTAVNKYVGGDYYDFSGADTVPQGYLYKPQDFENYDKGIAYSADLIERGEAPEALTFLMQFLQLDDLDEQTIATVEYNCGICCLYMGDYNQAVIYLSDAARKTDSPYAYFNLGCAYISGKEYTHAENAFKMAVDLSSGTGSAATPEDQVRFRAALEDAKQQTGPV